MKRLVVLSTALAVACGGGGKNIIPQDRLLPEGDSPATQPAEPATQPAAVTPPAEPEKDPWAGRTDLIQPPAAAKPAAVNLPKVERFTLPNGLKVLVVASRDLPVVNMHLAVGAGEEDEPKGKRLLATYAALMLTRGTNKRNADEIAGTMDFIGGDLSANADLETTHVTCGALARDFATCLTLLPEVVENPVFPPQEMRQVADNLLGGLKNLRDDPEALAQEHLDNLLWGDDHPRGQPRTIEGVAAITREDLLAWHKAHFTPGNSILAVAGDVDPKTLKADLTRVFAPWKARPAQKNKLLKEPKLTAQRVRLIDNPALTQSQILIGQLGVAHGDKDYLPTTLMNFALGGSFNARLNVAVRVKGGKTYGASSGLERWRTRGAFIATTATRTLETGATLKILLDEMSKMKKEGPTADELAQGKANIAGGYASRFEGAADVALSVLGAELHGLGESYVREFPLRVDAVTLEQAKAAAARRLDPGHAVIVVVGKADDVGRQLEDLGLKPEKIGYLEPISARERAAARAKAPAPVDENKSAAGKKLMDAALAAKGGADKLRGLKDLKTVGKVKVTGGGQKLDGDWTRMMVAPDKLRIEVSVMGQTLIMNVAPEGVFQAVGAQSRELPPDLAAQAREGLWRDHDLILLRHLEPGTVVQAAGTVAVGKTSYDAVILRQADGGNETRVLLDPTTHLIFQLIYTEEGAQGMEEYGDYREVQGLMLPFKQHAEGGQQSFDVTVTEYQVNKGVAPGTFNKP